MITGKVRYVVIEFSDDQDVLSAWGPFPTFEEAEAWEGIPGHTGTYTVHSVRSAPQWFAEFTPDSETPEGDNDDG